jgi:hypothetical protein
VANRISHIGVSVTFLLSSIAAANAHGIVGARFFPATMAVDDPFAADELALPTVTWFKPGGEPRETEAEFEWSKTLFKGFALSFGGGYTDSPGGNGWNNLEITPIVTFAGDPETEFVASAAMSFEIGGSGTSGVAEPFTVYTPALLFGKGFGDLPDSAALLRPFAVTGRIGYAIPGTRAERNTVEWGGAIEYSLAYLTNNVRDVGLGSFASHLTPIVEFRFESPAAGDTTGIVNPGLLWSGQYLQVGVEAVIPVNSATGHHVGVMGQLHFYLDDIFPQSLGRPLFGDGQ